MPGIHLSRFINIGDNDDVILCRLCSCVFIDPLVTQCCQQTFCGDCVKQWIKEKNKYHNDKCPNRLCENNKRRLTEKKLSPPPRAIINLLNKLKLKCDFYEKGCVQQMVYERYKQHIRDCRFNPEAVCGNCREKNGRRNEHNCNKNLLAKHECFKNLKTSNDLLESYNKHLTERNEKLESINKELTNERNILRTELTIVKEKLDKTLNELKQKEEQYNTLSENYVQSNKNFSVNLNHYMIELSDVKKKSNEIITQLNEQLWQTNGQTNGQMEECKPFVGKNMKIKQEKD